MKKNYEMDFLRCWVLKYKENTVPHKLYKVLSS